MPAAAMISSRWPPDCFGAVADHFVQVHVLAQQGAGRGGRLLGPQRGVDDNDHVERRAAHPQLVEDVVRRQACCARCRPR